MYVVQAIGLVQLLNIELLLLNQVLENRVLCALDLGNDDNTDGVWHFTSQSLLCSFSLIRIFNEVLLVAVEDISLVFLIGIQFEWANVDQIILRSRLQFH